MRHIYCILVTFQQIALGFFFTVLCSSCQVYPWRGSMYTEDKNRPVAWKSRAAPQVHVAPVVSFTWLDWKHSAATVCREGWHPGVIQPEDASSSKPWWWMKSKYVCVKCAGESEWWSTQQLNLTRGKCSNLTIFWYKIRSLMSLRASNMS